MLSRICKKPMHCQIIMSCHEGIDGFYQIQTTSHYQFTSMQISEKQSNQPIRTIKNFIALTLKGRRTDFHLAVFFLILLSLSLRLMVNSIIIPFHYFVICWIMWFIWIGLNAITHLYLFFLVVCRQKHLLAKGEVFADMSQ